MNLKNAALGSSDGVTNAREAAGAPSAKGIQGKRKEPGFYSQMSSDELIAYAQEFKKKAGISRNGELVKANPSLYVTLLKREKDNPGTMEKAGFTRDTREKRNFGSMDAGEITTFARQLTEEKKISRRTELARTDPSLYHTLRKRSLLGRVFPKRGVERQKLEEPMVEGIYEDTAADEDAAAAIHDDATPSEREWLIGRWEGLASIGLNAESISSVLSCECEMSGDGILQIFRELEEGGRVTEAGTGGKAGEEMEYIIVNRARLMERGKNDMEIAQEIAENMERRPDTIMLLIVRAVNNGGCPENPNCPEPTD